MAAFFAVHAFILSPSNPLQCLLSALADWLYLDHLAQSIPKPPNKRRLLILDNASWHKAKRLHWHDFQPEFLPAYSPDFNPIERLWLRLKADHFADFFAKSGQELIDHLCFALNSLMDDPRTVASQCAFRK